MSANKCAIEKEVEVTLKGMLENPERSGTERNGTERNGTGSN